MGTNDPFHTSDDGKTAGIISYLTIVGWLIAYFAIHQNNKTALGSYQLRQTLLFHIVSMVVSWILGMIFYSLFLTGGFFSALSLSWIVKVAFFVLWLIGSIGAINGEKKPIPLIGERAQSIFSTI